MREEWNTSRKGTRGPNVPPIVLGHHHTLYYQCVSSKEEYFSSVEEVSQWISNGPILQPPCAHVPANTNVTAPPYNRPHDYNHTPAVNDNGSPPLTPRMPYLLGPTPEPCLLSPQVVPRRQHHQLCPRKLQKRVDNPHGHAPHAIGSNQLIMARYTKPSKRPTFGKNKGCLRTFPENKGCQSFWNTPKNKGCLYQS